MVATTTRSTRRGPLLHLRASTLRNSLCINLLATEGCELRPIGSDASARVPHDDISQLIQSRQMFQAGVGNSSEILETQFFETC